MVRYGDVVLEIFSPDECAKLNIQCMVFLGPERSFGRFLLKCKRPVGVGADGCGGQLARGIGMWAGRQGLAGELAG